MHTDVLFFFTMEAQRTRRGLDRGKKQSTRRKRILNHGCTQRGEATTKNRRRQKNGDRKWKQKHLTQRPQRNAEKAKLARVKILSKMKDFFLDSGTDVLIFTTEIQRKRRGLNRGKKQPTRRKRRSNHDKTAS